VLGDPTGVRLRLEALVEETGADEPMVMSMVHDHAARLRSYELLAGAFAPRARGQAEPGDSLIV
jgi:alkanesulfonate monooxygenase SsuD/methylene tetrahydromethanopterin reductase-like flavin-dependent oxidoreductase (luciferase family)